MGDEADRWRRNRFALVEWALLIAAASGVLWLGARAGEPVDSLFDAGRGCTRDEAPGGPPIVRLELAVPDEDGEERLATLDDLLRCADRGRVGKGLNESTERDFLFIPAYVVLLAWCSMRMGGLRGQASLLPLVQLTGQPASRRARFVAWLDRLRTGPLAFTPLESRTRAARIRAKSAIVDARAEEALERRRIRRDTPSNLSWWRRLRHRRDKARPARERRRQAVAAAKKERDAAIARARADLPGQRSTRWWRRAGRALLAPVRAITADGLHLARVDRNDLSRLVGRIGAWCAVVAGLLDAAENWLLFRTADALVASATADALVVDATEVKLTAAFASAKFVLLALPVALALVFLVQLLVAAFRSKAVDHAEHDVYVPATRDDEWRWAVPRIVDDRLAASPVEDGGEYGICFSGGGIRSATFALGALQELETLKAGHAWSIRKARYIAAVSGGSYMAAAYQFLSRRGVGADGDADLRDVRVAPRATRRALLRMTRWRVVGALATRLYYRTLPAASAPAPAVPAELPLLEPAGPVEDHLRRHATHLADGAAEWIHAAGEVIIRALTGLAILLLAIWTVAVPLGWAYQYVFHGLHEGSADPSVDLRVVAIPLGALVIFAALRLLGVKPWDILTRRGDESHKPDSRDHARAATTFAITALVVLVVGLPFAATRMESAATTAGGWLGIDPPAKPSRDDVNARLETVMTATSATAAAAVDAAAQAKAGTPSAALAASADAVELAAALANDAVADLARSVDKDDKDADDPPAPPPLAVRFDPATCATVGTVPAGADESAVVRACRTARAAADTAAALGALARSRPAAPSTDEAAAKFADAVSTATKSAADASAATRELADELSGAAKGRGESAPVAWAGFTALVTALGGLFAKRRLDVGNRPQGSKTSANRVARMLGFRGLVEVVAGVAAVLVALVAFSDVVVDAWERGAREDLVVFVTQPAWVWWLVAAGLLTAAMLTINANNWSLRPFYHRRLWLPYAVTPEGHTAPWKTDTRFSVVGARVEGFPELIVCAAAQTSGRQWAPPGRRALSFVFTADAVGGPEIGYMRMSSLEATLGPKHRTAVTLFGAVATSGAAFGPAMGRHSRGGLGAVMAIANARLGAWMPNPHHVHELASVRRRGAKVRAGSLSRWPRLWYWFMEIVGQYPNDAKLALTTDGGHVENLGLVELLRRRCGRILCFDASGAGATPATLAEAIVLAREELGVTITLRPPEPPGNPDAAPPEELLDLTGSGADPLRRRASAIEQLVARIAGRPVLVADIEYPPVGALPKARGVLIYGTLALDERDAWDLLEYAHRNDVFPNDGTGRQWFDASTFSAYQQLGRTTARRMLEAAAPPPPPSRRPRPAQPRGRRSDRAGRLG